MANRERGEVSLTISGQSYTLVMNTNAMIALQGVYSKPGKAIVKFEDILTSILDGSFEHMRAFFWAALQKYHPEIATVEQAGEWMDEAGGIIGLSALIAEVNSASSPDVADVRELKPRGGGGGNPPLAQETTAGTGDSSSSKRKKSA